MRRWPVGPAHPVAVGHRQSSQVQYALAPIGSRRHCMRRLPSGPADTVCVGYHRVPQTLYALATIGSYALATIGSYALATIGSYASATIGSRTYSMCRLPSGPADRQLVGFPRHPQSHLLQLPSAPAHILNLGHLRVLLPSWSPAPAGTREFAICWVPLVPTNLVYIGGWWLPHPSLSQ